MEMTVKNFQWHAFAMATSFGVDLVLDPTLARNEAAVLRTQSLGLERLLGMSDTIVHASPIDDETSYAVVMHEIGHVVAPNGWCAAKQPPPGAHPRDWFTFYAAKLVAEDAAWEWAQYYIEQVFVWTAAMEQVKQYGLGTYQHARARGGAR